MKDLQLNINSQGKKKGVIYAHFDMEIPKLALEYLGELIADAYKRWEEEVEKRH